VKKHRNTEKQQSCKRKQEAREETPVTPQKNTGPVPAGAVDRQRKEGRGGVGNNKTKRVNQKNPESRNTRWSYNGSTEQPGPTKKHKGNR